MSLTLGYGLLLLSLISVPALVVGSDSGIRLVKTSESAVDVYVGKRLFTSYRYGLGLHKPVFFPVYSPGGAMVNRGYPLVFGIQGESHDHWHHESLWFTYGNVNNVDFWAKSGFQHENPESETGKIVHTGFTRIESDGDVGHLSTTADWVQPDGYVVLKQASDYVFRYDTNTYIIDFKYILTAQSKPVTFYDTKEGMFAIRVNPQLREDHTGKYLNSAGKTREREVWGKRAEWVALSGSIGGEELVLAIFNHPKSVNFPTFWHARGYGLFAANPFGRVDFEKGSKPINYSLKPGESATFMYRLMIHSGEMSPDQLKKQYEKYKETY